MRFGVCTYGWIPEIIPQGMDFIEASIPHLLVPMEPDSVFGEKLARAKSIPIPIESGIVFLPWDMKTTGPAVDQKTLDAYVHRTLGRAAKVGMKVVVFGSGGSRKVPDGFSREQALEQLVGHLRRWSTVAGDLGITFAVENLRSSETNILNTVREVVDFVRLVDRANVGALVDTFHMTCEGESPDSIVKAKGCIAHVHCAEQKLKGIPGTLGEDFGKYLHALKAIDYQGRVSIESDVILAISNGLQYLRGQYDKA